MVSSATNTHQLASIAASCLPSNRLTAQLNSIVPNAHFQVIAAPSLCLLVHVCVVRHSLGRLAHSLVKSALGYYLESRYETECRNSDFNQLTLGRWLVLQLQYRAIVPKGRATAQARATDLSHKEH
eukprot:53161-Amphidinium_carterae.1